MSRSIVLVLGVCVFSAHTAVYRTQDATLNRIVRSPHYGSGYDHDNFDLPPPFHGPPPHHGPPPQHGPPPPPIVYHTQNWSGVAKGLGGGPQGVFSGAAASAQSAAPALSEAFSIAASETGPLTSNEGGQVTENIEKSGFGGQFRGPESHHSDGSVGNGYSGVSKGFGSSNEGQYNIKSSGLELEGGVSGGGSLESENQSNQIKAGASGFDKKIAGGVSTGYGGLSGHLTSVHNDREPGQRSINSGFGGKSFGGKSSGYESQSSQYGSFEGAGETENRGDIGSEALNNGNSAGSTSRAFGSKSGQYDFQTSNKAKAGINKPSGGDNAESGFGSESASNQFGQYSGSGYQGGGGTNRKFESHAGGYGPRRQSENPSSGYENGHDYHRDDHRHGKSHHETDQFEENGKQFGYKGSDGQGFGHNGQIHSTGFSNSHSSSFGNDRRNYGPGLSSSERGNSGNFGQVEQSRGLDTGLTANQAGHGYHRDDHRHGKSNHETDQFEENGKKFGYQGSDSQGFGHNGQIHSTGFSNSHSSSFGNDRRNYGPGLSSSERGNSGNFGQVEQSRGLDTGLTANQAGSHDLTGAQQVKQSGQLHSGFSASQTGSQELSGGQSQTDLGASGYEFKKSGSLNNENKGALVAGNANSGISSAGEAEGSLSADAGASGQDNVQSTLSSALNLASQGLQAAQQTPCSTCNKGSYALSNAKSHSGSAIALSIGG